MYDYKALCRGVAAALLISASAGLHATPTTYNYTITGVVEVGDELSPNAFGLTGNFGLPGGETITAFGTFTVDDSYATNGGTVSFEAGSGNTLTIDLNGTLLYASDDAFYPAGGFAGPTMEFTSNWTLLDFAYDKESSPAFFSSFLFFDDTDMMMGHWEANSSVSAVPEAETYAMMLAGLGLVGFMGARRKKLQTAV